MHGMVMLVSMKEVECENLQTGRGGFIPLGSTTSQEP